MSVPFEVIFDPMAQLTYGFVGVDVNEPEISGIGLVTFGFLWDGIWDKCCDEEIETVWEDCC